MSVNPRTVVVFDQDPAVRMMFLVVLGDRGFRVHAAPSLPETLTLCVLHQPEIALVELGLSSAVDFQFLTDLKAASPATKVCVTNASGGPLPSETLRSLGLRHFLSKPFDLDELLSALDWMVGPPASCGTC